MVVMMMVMMMVMASGGGDDDFFPNATQTKQKTSSCDINDHACDITTMHAKINDHAKILKYICVYK